MLLKKITEAAGVAGDEYEVRAVIREALNGVVEEIHTDMLGNLIAVQNKVAKGPRILLDAHMDEIGLMIVFIEPTGLLRFKPVGGIDARVLVAKTVRVGTKKIPGVIGAKAIHLQKPEERQSPIPIDALLIDIGAKNKEEAEKVVSVGDYAVFDTDYEEFGDGKAKAKAFDDRIGCAVIVEVLKEKFTVPVYAVFSVSEEIGLRGAGTAAFVIDPQIGIAIEGCTAHDVTDVEDHLVSTHLGAGPSITLMDKSLISDKKLIALAAKTAEELGIPYQFRNTATGGNDGGKINQTRGGVAAIELAVPTRYVHSPISIIQLSDYEQTIALVKAFVHAIERGGFEIK